MLYSSSNIYTSYKKVRNYPFTFVMYLISNKMYPNIISLKLRCKVFPLQDKYKDHFHICCINRTLPLQLACVIERLFCLKWQLRSGSTELLIGARLRKNMWLVYCTCEQGALETAEDSNWGLCILLSFELLFSITFHSSVKDIMSVYGYVHTYQRSCCTRRTCVRQHVEALWSKWNKTLRKVHLCHSLSLSSILSHPFS